MKSDACERIYWLGGKRQTERDSDFGDSMLCAHLITTHDSVFEDKVRIVPFLLSQKTIECDDEQNNKFNTISLLLFFDNST